jgi:hypothetical protein
MDLADRSLASNGINTSKCLQRVLTPIGQARPFWLWPSEAKQPSLGPIRAGLMLASAAGIVKVKPQLPPRRQTAGARSGPGRFWLPAPAVMKRAMADPEMSAVSQTSGGLPRCTGRSARRKRCASLMGPFRHRPWSGAAAGRYRKRRDCRPRRVHTAHAGHPRQASYPF